MLAGWSSIFWLHKLRQPTLILHSDDDPFVPLVNAKIMHGLIPHSKLYIFHDGHLGLGTSAWEITQVVEKFLTAPCAGYVAHPFPKEDGVHPRFSPMRSAFSRLASVRKPGASCEASALP